MIMEVPQLNTCCGFISLRSGSKIIGWLSLVLGTICIAGLITILVFFVHLEGHPKTKEEDLVWIKVAILVAVLNLIVYGIQTISGFILLLGAYQAKAKLVYWWVIANIVAATLNVVFSIVLGFITADEDTWLFLVGCVGYVYFILVVYSYYREIQNSPVYSV